MEEHREGTIGKNVKKTMMEYDEGEQERMRGPGKSTELNKVG